MTVSPWKTFFTSGRKKLGTCVFYDLEVVCVSRTSLPYFGRKFAKNKMARLLAIHESQLSCLLFEIKARYRIAEQMLGKALMPHGKASK